MVAPSNPVRVSVVRVEQHELVLRVRGEIDASTGPTLRQDLLSAVATYGVSTVAVDMSEVEFADSTIAKSIVVCRRALRDDGGTLTVRSPSTPVLRILQITGLDDVLE